MLFRMLRAVGPKTRVALALLLAVACFGLGTWDLTRTDVSCGGESMSPGDICEVTKNGTTTNVTYESQRQDQKTTGYILLGAGVVLLGAGVFFITRVRQQPAAAATATAS
jgi:hypothetical protein